jgi:hypothetical protein
VGTTSSPVTLTIMNAATGAALADMKLSVSSGFALTSNTCTSALAAGVSCTTGVTFTPSSAGAQSGTFTFSSSTVSAAMTAPLTGMGFEFQAAVAGSTTQTVSSGQTASYSLMVVPAGGSSGTFSFQCGTLPSEAGCTFVPSMLPVGANATGTEEVQVTTSQTQSAATRSPAVAGSTARSWQSPILVLGLLLVPPVWRRRRRVLWALMAIFLGIGVSSCSSSGGGSGGGSPSGTTTTTPAGTYSIPVTINSNGVQHTVTLSLVVD